MKSNKVTVTVDDIDYTAYEDTLLYEFHVNGIFLDGEIPIVKKYPRVETVNRGIIQQERPYVFFPSGCSVILGEDIETKKITS